MTTSAVPLEALCQLKKGSFPIMKTNPGVFPLVVTAAFRRSADGWDIEGPAVCIPLVSSTGHGDAALHRLHYQEGRFALANLLVALTPRDKTRCNTKYLYYLLNAKKDEYFVPLMLGTANVSLKEKDIARVEVQLPPIEKQERVVRIVESVESHVSIGLATRSGIAQQTSALLSAIEHDVWSVSAIEKGLPLGKVTKYLARGRQSSQGPSDHYLVKSRHVQLGRYLDTNLTLSSQAASRVGPEGILRNGDVLIACSAAGCLGRVACFTSDGKTASTDTHVAIARADQHVVSSDYLYYYLKSEPGQVQLRSRERGDWTKEKTGFRLAELNLSDLRNVPVPVPPLLEQRGIVSYLQQAEEQLARINGLNSEIELEMRALVPSIIDKALRGEL